MVKAIWYGLMGRSILENGAGTNSMGMVSTSGRMAANTAVTGNKVNSMGKEKTFIQMEDHTQESTPLAKSTDLELMSGLMARHMKATGRTIRSMGKENGQM